jgi:CubicO group peptidase (beta-lactamase class C family)
MIDRTLVDGVFELHRRLNRAPRMAWGVVVDGALVHAAGYDANEHTAFRIASMTKSFTAAAVLALRDDGALALDVPVATYAPELAALRPPNGDAEPITLRHLLTMTSGLATDDAWADRTMDVDDAGLDGIVATGGRFAAAPGTTHEYSNLGYGLIGRVVQRVAGRTLQSVVQSRLLDPLGMTATRWSADALPAATDVATGFSIVGDEYVEEPPVGDGALAPMAGLYSTVADLARWTAFLADAFPARDGVDDGPLRRSSRREMQRVASLGAPGTGSYYGMGIRIDPHPTLGLLLGHSGGLPGFGSNMRWSPEAGIGMVALADVTYARMADAVRAAFDVLAATHAAQSEPTPVDADLARASAELVALLADWDDTRARSLFTHNVALDESLARRATAAQALAAEHGGGFVIERIDAVSATTASVHVRGARSSFVVELELAPFGAPRVQWYEIS